MSNTITGRLHLVKPTQTVSEKFSKREFVIETAEQYPQQVQIELQQDKCGLLDGYHVGDTVTVDFNIRGRAWQSPSGEVKYFNTLQAWKISREAGSTVQSTHLKDVQTEHLHTPQPTQYPSGTIGENLSDSLPF